MRLFENNLHRSANPDLRLFEVEDRCYCGSYIVLHHAYIVKPKPFLDILAGNDERSFHLLHRLSAMSFVDATMIGSQYENSIIKDSCFFYCLDNLTHVCIQFFEFLIICRSVMSLGMAGMVGTVITNGNESRMLLLDISGCLRRTLSSRSGFLLSP